MKASDFYDVDVTDRVECYENGKTFECDCGQGFGVPYDEEMWTCPTCGKTLFDRKAEEREPPEIEGGQATLGDW